jgi:uncharacterized protein
MNSKTKIYFGAGFLVIALLFAGAYFCYVNAYSRSIQPSAYRSFSVSADAKVVAVPDVSQFTFSVITEGGKDIASLQKTNTDKINKAIDFLKAKGIDQKDIKTLNYSLDPKYTYYNCPHPESSITPCPPAQITGYTITQTVSVKVRDFTKIGDVLGGVVDNGANSVSQLSFTIDDPTSLENQARDQAIAKAIEKAKLTAQAGGFKLGRLLSIDEGYTPYYSYGGGISAKDMSSIPSNITPNIEPGSQEVTANVALRYEIK